MLKLTLKAMYFVVFVLVLVGWLLPMMVSAKDTFLSIGALALIPILLVGAAWYLRKLLREYRNLNARESIDE